MLAYDWKDNSLIILITIPSPNSKGSPYCEVVKIEVHEAKHDLLRSMLDGWLNDNYARDVRRLFIIFYSWK